MPEKEYFYKAEVRWTGEKTGSLSLGGKPDLPLSPPPEFEGRPEMTSPQELFVSSAAACLMTTFLSMAKKVRAEWEDFSCSGRGKLEMVPDQGLIFTRIDLYPKVKVKADGNVKKVERALDLAKKHCLVANSMKAEVEMHPEVSVA